MFSAETEEIEEDERKKKKKDEIVGENKEQPDKDKQGKEESRLEDEINKEKNPGSEGVAENFGSTANVKVDKKVGGERVKGGTDK